MQHVKWKYQKHEDDNKVHFLKDAEYTLCGCAFEGGLSTKNQGFIKTNDIVTCSQCIDIVLICKKVKNSEFRGIKI